MSEVSKSTEGTKSSEHRMYYIMVMLSALFGAIAELGLPESHWAVKVTAMVLPIIGALGYGSNRSKVKSAAKMLIFCLFLGLVAGCKGMIPVADIEEPVNVIVNRHNDLVDGKIDLSGDLTGDGKVDSKDEAKKRSWKRTGDLLIRQLEAAKSKD